MGLNSKITKEDYDFMINYLERENNKFKAEGSPIMTKPGEKLPVMPQEMEIYIGGLAEEFFSGLSERFKEVCRVQPMSYDDYLFVSLASLIENVMHIGIAVGEHRKEFFYVTPGGKNYDC